MLNHKLAKILTISSLMLAFFLSFASFLLTLNQPFNDFSLVRLTVFGRETSIDFRIDFLASTLCLMVTLLALVIANYSNRYLSGEAKKAYFYWRLLAIVLTVIVLLVSNNMISFILSWYVISCLLQGLLKYFPHRPGAILAARKKLYIDAIGCLALSLAFIGLYSMTNTINFSEIASSLKAQARLAPGLEAISILIVLAALAKSAQFPFHIWLPESLETPTPVSALMHAGVINAGGFLIIRFSWLLEWSSYSYQLISILGAMTAVFGALCMVTQNSIKKKLAYSTMSQMGMMMFACGLQLYGVALFHILVHSFYKAHAFLSTGSVIEEKDKISLKLVSPPQMLVFVAIIVNTSILTVLSSIYGPKAQNIATYAAVLLLGLIQNYAEMPKKLVLGLRPYGLVLIILCIATIGYVSIDSVISNQLAMSFMDRNNFMHANQSNISPYIAYGIFTLGFYISHVMTKNQTKLSKALYIFFWNGGYLSQFSTRLFKLRSNQNKSYECS